MIRDPRALLAGILIVAAWLRFALLGHNSLTFDEMYPLRIVLHRWQDIPAVLKTAEFHPPLYYLMTKAWLSVAPDFGDGTVRVPSAFLSLASVALTYLLVRRLAGEPVALLSAVLVAVSPFAVMAGQELRMYPLVTALFLGSSYALVEAAERGGWVRWVAYVLLAAALVYTHYLGVLVLLGQGIWIAWYARSHLREWAAAMVGAAILFAPWAPSLLVQAGHGGAWWIVGEGSFFQVLVHVLSLFAFGGSLLGMPRYNYFNTDLSPVEQIGILLPFLIVLGVGTWALLRDRGRFALLAIPAALALGVPLGLTLGKTDFHARWYSFLVPVYSACIARGIFEIAHRVRGHPLRVVAGLLAALLLYDGAVLSGYYFDPDFAVFHWRERAALVKAHVRPGDFFVYGIPLDAAAFTYYFGISYPGMVLFPHPDFERMRRLTASHPRVWLVIAHPATDAMLNQAVAELQRTFQFAGQAPGGGKRIIFPMVYLFRANPARPGADPAGR